MQKLLSLLSPAGFFPRVADESPKERAPFRRSVVVSYRGVKPNAPARLLRRFRLSAQHIWMISLALVAINAVLFVSYIFSVNSQANTGFTIKQLENKISEQTTLNKKLLVEASEAHSIASVQTSISNSDFVPITANDSMFVQVNQLSQK